jgi:hypothetical protein
MSVEYELKYNLFPPAFFFQILISNFPLLFYTVFTREIQIDASHRNRDIQKTK